jgi:hypothetical protein
MSYAGITVSSEPNIYNPNHITFDERLKKLNEIEKAEEEQKQRKKKINI